MLAVVMIGWFALSSTDQQANGQVPGVPSGGFGGGTGGFGGGTGGFGSDFGTPINRGGTVGSNGGFNQFGNTNQTGTGTTGGATLDQSGLATVAVNTRIEPVTRGRNVGTTQSTGAGFSTVTAAPGVGAGSAARSTNSLGGFGGASNFGGLGGFNNPAGLGASTVGTTPAIRTRLRSAIVLPTRSGGALVATAPRIRASPTVARRYAGVTPSRSGGTTVLSGTVATERDRRMSQLLLSLEPGVRRIDNRIRVAPQ